MQNQVFEFLNGLPLFADLPVTELRRLADTVSVRNYPEGTILSVPGRTKLDSLYLIREGALELFYDQDGERKLSGYLKPGEIFGGISILMNAGFPKKICWDPGATGSIR